MPPATGTEVHARRRARRTPTQRSLTAAGVVLSWPALGARLGGLADSGAPTGSSHRRSRIDARAEAGGSAAQGTTGASTAARSTRRRGDARSCGSRASARATRCRCWRAPPTTRWPPGTGTSPAPADARPGGQLRAGGAPDHPRRAAARDARPPAGRRGDRRDPRDDRTPTCWTPAATTWWCRSPRPGWSTRCRPTPDGGVEPGAEGRPAADHADHLLGALPHRQPDDRLRAPRLDDRGRDRSAAEPARSVGCGHDAARSDLPATSTTAVG